MFKVFTSSHFSAAHFIRGHGGSCENLHGHNWMVKVWVCRENLDQLGMVLDFKILKKHLKDVLKKLDHENLNDLDIFKNSNPTAEEIARHIFIKLDNSLKKDFPDDSFKICSIEVDETPGNGVMFSID